MCRFILSYRLKKPHSLSQSLPCIINSREDTAGFWWLWLSAVARLFFISERNINYVPGTEAG